METPVEPMTLENLQTAVKFSILKHAHAKCIPLIVRISESCAFPLNYGGVIAQKNMNADLRHTSISGRNYHVVLQIPEESRKEMEALFNSESRAHELETALTDAEKQLQHLHNAFRVENEKKEHYLDTIRKYRAVLHETNEKLLAEQDKNRVFNKVIEANKVTYIRDKSKINKLVNDLKEQRGAIKCSVCGRPMQARTNGLTGGKFWGCSGYPDKCTHTRPFSAAI